MAQMRNRLKYVSTNVWNISKEDAQTGNFSFPEADFEYIRHRKNVGIAFSGGGTRSASATMGQLRALKQLGLLEKTKYISCVSGGSWAAIPFSFLLNDIADDLFLGDALAPEEITFEHLDHAPRKSLAYAVSHSSIVDDFIKAAIQGAGDETYSRAIGDIFLAPFQLNGLKRFFTCDRDTVGSIIDRNPKMRPSDFYYLNTDRHRPFVIAGGTILRSENKDKDKQRIHFEFTPLYVGASGFHEGAGSRGRDIGGGFVEPFGFDSDAPEPDDIHGTVAEVRLGKSRHRLTLSDVVGTSGAAPAEVLDKLHLDFLGFPEFKYWAPACISPDAGEHAKAKEYEFGDGGILENLGVMPLLRRRVDKMIVFVNTQHDIQGGTHISDSIPPLFGKAGTFTYNHVFEDTGGKYQKLVEGLIAKKNAGKPAVFQDTYTVRANPNFGIAGGRSVTVIWVYNEQVADFEQRLPQSIENAIHDGKFGNFPHYKTFFENFPFIIDLSARQVNLLGHLSYFNIWSNQNQFTEFYE
ncbi:MAG: hypothetical protein QNJ97_09420 [Myxococcota bacterium]|nr:hypothetical protein [Myxococcota bacterium]